MKLLALKTYAAEAVFTIVKLDAELTGLGVVDHKTKLQIPRACRNTRVIAILRAGCNHARLHVLSPKDEPTVTHILGPCHEVPTRVQSVNNVLAVRILHVDVRVFWKHGICSQDFNKLLSPRVKLRRAGEVDLTHPLLIIFLA